MATEPSYNYSYTPTVDHRESNLYREEYYSSTDTKIYMDDEEQTEIGYIQYDLQEQLKPVYGYNSRTFDDVVIGNRIVTGQFTVPIKNKAEQVFDNKSKSSKDTKLQSNANQYNLKEENNLFNTDWIGSTNKNKESNNTNVIDTDFLNKLSSLGYDVDSNSTYYQYKKALKEFQKNNNIAATGVLNELTKSKMEKALR